MKFLIAIIIVTVLGNCSSQKMGTKKDFTFVDATSQKWTGGVQGSGWGTRYIFTLEKNTDSYLSFDTIWIEERPYIPEKAMNNQQIDTVPAGNKFKLVAEYRYRENPYTQETEVTPEKSENPPSYEGAALIIYRKNGERKTYTVKGIRILPPELYP